MLTNRRFCLLTTFLVFILFKINAQDTTRLQIFSKSKVFPIIVLDPLESFFSGGSYLIINSETSPEGILNNVNPGINKPVLSYHGKRITLEGSLSVSAYNLFQISRYETNDKLIGALTNIDYKVGGEISLRIQSITLRTRLFHMSSHYGDDYIIRNGISLPNDRSGNYEQIDFTLLKYLNSSSFFYLGGGGIYSKYVYRKRYSAWTGVKFYQNTKSHPNINLFESLYLSIFQEYNYSPNLRLAFGFNILQKQREQFSFWIEYYNGYIPYGTIFTDRISWFGIGGALYLN